MIRLTKLPWDKKPTKRMLELSSARDDFRGSELEKIDEGDFSWHVGAEGIHIFANLEQANDLRPYWLAALADFYKKKNFSPHALFQLGAREVESYLRDANHVQAFEVTDEHERFHQQLQLALAFHLTLHFLRELVPRVHQKDWPSSYVQQAAWIQGQLIQPLQHFYKSALGLEWVYYGAHHDFPEQAKVLVWNFKWGGPSELWTQSTKISFQNGFLQAGGHFCLQDSSPIQLKWVAEREQLP